MRQDGTRAYYFTLEELQGLMAAHGFGVVQLCYVQKQMVNHKQGLDVPRVFVQGVFVRS